MATLPARGLPGVTSVPPRPRDGLSAPFKVGIGLALVALLVYSWINVGGSVNTLFSGLFGHKGLIRTVIPQSLPPDLSVLGGGLKASVTTFCVAVLSTFFAMILSIVALLLSARNTTPNRVVYEATRFVMAILRAIPELILLLLFLFTIGITPFSSVIALTFHGIGVQGKLYAEAVEEMHMAPIEALRVAGASRVQVFLHAVLPSVRSTLLGLTLYRFDANFRSAVVLGAVGGGGIGFLIDNTINVFEFKQVMTYIIIMIVWILAIERVSTVLRARLT